MLKDAVTFLSHWVLPIFILVVIGHGYIKGINIFEAFIAGAREGFMLAVKLIPYVVAIYVAIGVFRETGAMNLLAGFIDPVLSIFGVPAEIVPLMVARPLSGPASLGLTVEMLERHGPDSFLGLLASTVYGSTETTFYVLAVYFASVGIKNARYAPLVGILADLGGFAGAVIVCNLLYK